MPQILKAKQSDCFGARFSVAMSNDGLLRKRDFDRLRYLHEGAYLTKPLVQKKRMLSYYWGLLEHLQTDGLNGGDDGDVFVYLETLMGKITKRPLLDFAKALVQVVEEKTGTKIAGPSRDEKRNLNLLRGWFRNVGRRHIEYFRDAVNLIRPGSTDASCQDTCVVTGNISEEDESVMDWLWSDCGVPIGDSE
jgi:hypothetical protein